MRYPFHIGENLTALTSARNFDAVLHVAGRNFDLVMNAHSQSQTLRKLRVVQLQATLTRAIYRAGAEPTRLFDCEMAYLEKIKPGPRRGSRRVTRAHLGVHAGCACAHSTTNQRAPEPGSAFSTGGRAELLAGP